MADAFTSPQTVPNAVERAHKMIAGARLSQPGEPDETVIADAVADLLHLADSLGLDTPTVLDSATRHYFAERG